MDITVFDIVFWVILAFLIAIALVNEWENR